MKIEAVIFDWAGTTVDYGCFAPVQAFHDAFEAYGLHPTFDEIRQPMGMLKIDHIKTMLEMDSLKKNFKMFISVHILMKMFIIFMIFLKKH
ncbi:MAG: hypothetical protein ACLSBH_13430 [Coprobacillus cateniformis]